MEGFPGKHAKPSFITKWWFWGIIAIALVVALVPSRSQSPSSEVSSATASATTSATVSTTPPSANASPTIDLSAQSQQLISAIAASTNAEVMGTETFNPYEEHKQGGPHSRVEYRLDAYKESAGVHGTINGVSVDTVVYRNGKMQRVYLFGNENDVMALYPQVAKVLDLSLSDADITAAVTKYQTDEAKTQTDLLSLSDSHRLMQSDSIIGSGNDCEAFMDANTGN